PGRRLTQVALRCGGMQGLLRRRGGGRADPADAGRGGELQGRGALTRPPGPRAALYKSARRYEPGTLPTHHILGLSASLDLLAEIGAETALRRVQELVTVLADGLRTRGWRGA